MTNREQLARMLDNAEYEDKEITDMISDALMEIRDDDDSPVAIIFGNKKKLLTEWLGKECDNIG